MLTKTFISINVLIKSEGNDSLTKKKENEMSMNHENEFNAKGFALEKFLASDTRRIGPDGEKFALYASKKGQIKARFETSRQAGEWIEFR